MCVCPTLIVLLHASSSASLALAQQNPAVATPEQGGSAIWLRHLQEARILEACRFKTQIPGGSGISVSPVYYGELFTNARGGISTSGATQYQGLLDLPVEFDLERLATGLPGRFVLLAQNTHGQGLSNAFIGDFQTVSNIDSFNNIMQVSEYWWEVPLGNGDVLLRLGKQDINTEFLLIDIAQDYIQSSFGLPPTAGLPSYPDPSAAAVILADLSEAMRLKLGVWDLFADGSGWGFSGNGITLSIAELECTYALKAGTLSGQAEIGVLYGSGGRTEQLNFPSEVSTYVQLQQQLYRECPNDEGNIQGLSVFASYARRYPENALPVTAISENAVAGLMYHGFVAARDDDVLGIGASWARLNQGGSREETAFEVFYKAQLTPTFSVQPDIQYVISPSGIYPDALVAGVRFQLAF